MWRAYSPARVIIMSTPWWSSGSDLLRNFCQPHEGEYLFSQMLWDQYTSVCSRTYLVLIIRTRTHLSIPLDTHRSQNSSGQYTVMVDLGVLRRFHSCPERILHLGNMELQVVQQFLSCIYMYVCIFIYVCVCVYICMYVYTYIYVYIFIYVCVCTCMYLCVYRYWWSKLCFFF